MSGVGCWLFRAFMTRKNCGGHARQVERMWGWNRDTVEPGVHEQRTGIMRQEIT